MPSSFTTQTMNRIDQLRPSATPASKPLMPWVAAVATLVVAIFIGLGQQSMTRSQRPYSLDATESSVEVELVDAPAIYRPETKLILANRSGGVNQRNEKSDARPDGTGLGSTSNVVKNLGLNGSKWVQTNGPTGGRITRILRASDDSLYAATDSPRVFRSDTNGDIWIDVGKGLEVYPDGQNPWAQSITEADGIIYLNDDLGFFHSNTRGASWHWVKYPDRTEASTAFAVSSGRIYINRDRDGVVYSDNYGKSWTPIHYGLPAKPPDRLMTVGTTLFAKIGDELFRLKANETSWTRITTFQNLRFFTATQSALVIGNRTDLRRSTDEGDTWIPMTGKVRLPSSEGEENTREFRLLITAERKGLILTTQIGTLSSTRELEVWIPPMTTKDGDGSLKEMKSNEVDSSKSQVPTVFEFRVLSIEGIAALGNTVHLLLSDGKLLRSTENGRWITTETEWKNREVNSMVALSEHSVCVATDEGAYRWRDGEKSWRQINKGLVSTYVHDLVSYKNALYAITSYTIVKSVDGGNRWMPVHQGLPSTEASTFAIADDVLYLALNETTMGSRTKPSTAGIYSLAPDENSWTPVQTEMRTDDHGHRRYHRLYSVDELVISGNTFYAIAQMGSGWRTYRWRRGDRFWTAISPDVERSSDSIWSGLAVSGDTVYFNARDNLMCSNNRGNTWSRIDTFPQHNGDSGQIKGPVSIGNDVYIAVSNLGVFRSTNRGKTWESLDAGLPQAYSWELDAVEN
ncbi:MAG: hypothetical protein OXT74_11145, partial [Candidatus Poribacteria bacterium]|nr:hypothetical protein [Candidatus Poribacteria bacterium]